MKKILIATTALVATAGVAAADVSLSGSARMGLTYDDGRATDEVRLHTRVRINFTATGETDGGLTWGARARIQSSEGAGSVNQGKIWIGGGWGTLTVGDTDPSGDDFGLKEVGFKGIGIDDLAEASGYTGSANVRYDGEFGNLTVVATTYLGYDGDAFGAGTAATIGGDLTWGTADDVAATSAGSSDGDYSFGIGYNFGNFQASLAFDHDEWHDSVGVGAGGSANAFAGGENDSVEARIQGTFGAVTAGLYLADNDVHGSGYGIDLDYAVNDALTLRAVFASSDDDRAQFVEDETYGIGFAYGLGGGATLAGGLGQNSAGDTVADLGISLTF